MGGSLRREPSGEVGKSAIAPFDGFHNKYIVHVKVAASWGGAQRACAIHPPFYDIPGAPLKWKAVSGALRNTVDLDSEAAHHAKLRVSQPGYSEKQQPALVKGQRAASALALHVRRTSLKTHSLSPQHKKAPKPPIALP